MRNWRKILPLVVALGLCLVGCLSLEPQVIIQTRIVEKGAPRAASPTLSPSATPTMSPTASLTPILTASPESTANLSVTATPVITVRICFAPDTQPVRRAALYKEFTRLFGARSGMQVETIIADNYQAVADALCAGEVDVAWLATPAYIVAHDNCGAQAWFSVVRGGLATHTAEIIVQADAARKARNLAPINTLGDLGDKAFGFTDPLSTTGYLFPKAMLVENGVRLGSELFLGGDSQVALAVYKGEVDAGATYWRPPRSDGALGDGRAELLSDYPDVGQQLKILRLSQPIPNDPVVMRADLDADLRAKLVTAFVELAASREGRDLLDSLYDIDGLALVNDDDYAQVRKMGATLHLDFVQLAEGRYMPSQ